MVGSDLGTRWVQGEIQDERRGNKKEREKIAI